MVSLPRRPQLPGEAGVLAWVVRGHLVESVHTGHLVTLDPGGAGLVRIGSPEAQIYPRSSLKPIQALAMLRSGVQLDEGQLALACASHSGEPVHREVVASILAGAGLTEADLQNTPDLPLAADAAAQWRQDGNGPTSLTQNCSGKHAAMLATCVAAGWPTDTYLTAGHPLQQAILETITDLTGQRPAHVSVDGCGAPLASTTTTGLARAFARLATAPDGSHEARVAAAMRARPELVGGTGRDVTGAMRSVPGLIAKDGAEGVYAAALPDGRALAFKVADGGGRPRPVVLAAALAVLGAADGNPVAGWDWARVPVLGHGRPAGSVQPAFGPDAPDWGSPGTDRAGWQG